MYPIERSLSNQNPQLNLGIDFAPPKVRRHGLRETHLWPLVSRGKGPAGQYRDVGRRPASEAWDWRELEIRAAHSDPVLLFDVDGREGTLKALDLRDKRIIPPPNWMVVDDKSGGCHVAYTLARPVHRGVDARIRPLKYLARIEGWLSATMGADGAFPGVLTHNPMAKAQMRGRSTLWGRECPYSLPELSDYIPERWRRPAVYEGAVGRNCDLFAAGLKWAGREINLPYPVFEVLRQMNGATERPLPENEVSWIASSIERYRARWVAQGAFYSPEERTAWHRQGGFAWGQKTAGAHEGPQ